MAALDIRKQTTLPTLTLESFWSWLSNHANCILRAGTPESVIYDDDDFHWVLSSESEFLVAQMVRGKRLVTELFIHPEIISFVQGSQGEREGEFVFELVAENGKEQVTAVFFVLCHGLDDDAEHAGAVH